MSDRSPDTYPQLLSDLKAQIRSAQLRAHRAVNTELITLYWELGRTIQARQDQEGWGAKVIERLAADLRREFPDMRGLSRRNLHYMRQFAHTWPDLEVVQQAVAQLPWGHVTALLSIADAQAREWYASAAVEHGWSRSVLTHHIATGLHQRTGAAPSNFAATLPAGESDLAQELTRDPVTFDFLGSQKPARERDLEDALLTRMTDTLLALGHGFAFVGRQVELEVGADTFRVDLLFFHIPQARYVVVELKVGPFTPAHTGQLGFYVAVVDGQLRRPEHAPTVGILLCAGRDEQVVRYALGASTMPIAVADYTYDALPATEQQALPGDRELTEALASEISSRLDDPAG